MDHYILNTGHSRQSPRSEVGDHVIPKMLAWLVAGKHYLPFAGWSVSSTPGESGGLLFAVHHDHQPVITCGVAGDDIAADELWPMLEQFYLDLTDKQPHRGMNWQAPIRPTSTPWCAVVLVSLGVDVMSSNWLVDFERCMAWSWLELANNLGSLKALEFARKVTHKWR